FRSNLALAALELERGVQGVIQFLNENDEGANIGITQAATRVMSLELIDEPARIINPNIKLIAGVPQKSAGEFVQFARGSTGQLAELNGAGAIDNAIFQINTDLRVGAFEEALDLTEKRFVHKSVGLSPSSRFSKRSAS